MRLLTDRSDCLQWAGDASIYHLMPRLVAFPENVTDVQTLLRRRQSLTFRAGGTSLSGQAISDSILAVISEHWRTIEVLDGGARVRCGPGAVGAWVNAALAGHGRKIGPDPASIQAAEIGGIVANNASGMCCGIAHNSYRTIDCLDVVLADGFTFSTADDATLARERPQVHAGLAALRQRVHADPALVARIELAFASKNTVGYSLNAFLDETVPARILQKLLIGSEGTLAFIASATFTTVPLARYRATAWQIYADIDAACAAVPALAPHAAAIELLDAVSLQRVAAKLPGALPPGEPAALLIELQHDDLFELGAAMRQLPHLQFTSDAHLQARYWAVRKGLFPSVGAVRAAGTAVVIEDVTFPVTELAAGVRALRALFVTHGYADAVLFGHAKDGNLHFTLTPDFSQAHEVSRYAAFMAALADLVLAHGGHLKAEHGTGRNMAPFVTAQWGTDAVAIMQAVKHLLDPDGILNPGVVLNDDPQAHLRHLKTLPAVDPLIDACIECGFCEPVCPSRDFASSPRQRIQLLRAAARGEPVPDWVARGVESCAGDGLCATACPVNIDTGAAMRLQRARRRGAISGYAAAWSGRHVALITGLTRVALGIFGGRRLPGTNIPLPVMIENQPTAIAGTPTYVYFPSCVARTCGTVADDLRALCEAAGVGLELPAHADGLCCGQPFASKGFPAVEASVRAQAVAALSGRTVVTDTASCAAHLGMAVLDPATFVATVLALRLQLPQRSVWLHPTCADVRYGWDSQLRQAVPGGRVPLALGCCGMAGDKGWTVPGLTAAATAREQHENGHARCVTTSPTCAAALGGEHLFTWLRRHLADQSLM